VVDIHDDDPAAFLAMLSYLYTDTCTILVPDSDSRSSTPTPPDSEIDSEALDATAQALPFHTRLHALATTYAMPSLQHLCAKNLAADAMFAWHTPAFLTAVELHYTLLPSSPLQSQENSMSLAVASAIHAHRNEIWKDGLSRLQELLVTHPQLGADVAMEARWRWKRGGGGRRGRGVGRWWVVRGAGGMSCGFLRRWRCVGGVRRFVEGAVVGMNGRGVWEVEEVVEVRRVVRKVGCLLMGSRNGNSNCNDISHSKYTWISFFFTITPWLKLVKP
jgi:hypothetical protein